MLFSTICIFEPSQAEVQVIPIMRRSVSMATHVGNMAAVPIASACFMQHLVAASLSMKHNIAAACCIMALL